MPLPALLPPGTNLLAWSGGGALGRSAGVSGRPSGICFGGSTGKLLIEFSCSARMSKAVNMEETKSGSGKRTDTASYQPEAAGNHQSPYP